MGEFKEEEARVRGAGEPDREKQERRSERAGVRASVCTRLCRALLWAVISTLNEMGRLWRGFFSFFFLKQSVI